MHGGAKDIGVLAVKIEMAKLTLGKYRDAWNDTYLGRRDQVEGHVKEWMDINEKSFVSAAPLLIQWRLHSQKKNLQKSDSCQMYPTYTI